jgi:hypothetical protein
MTARSLFRTGFVAGAAMLLGAGTASASSHMDAPLITLDPAANTTDVYAFVNRNQGGKNLVVGVSVYPFEEPGIGPNKYNFDDNVRYKLHVALGDDLARGDSTLTYTFDFRTRFKKQTTILQSYLDVIQDVDDDAQNLTQTYTVTRFDRRSGQRGVIGRGVVPPNNQGIATPFYNQDNDGNKPARDGVATEGELDRYTRQAISVFDYGYRAFAGQRDDGFAADILGVFDLLQLRSPGVDSQAGFNIHFIGLEIPMKELGGDQQVVGVYASTERRRVSILAKGAGSRAFQRGGFVQVARQGNPLFNEALVALKDKDTYNRTSPRVDDKLFRKYAESPELARLLNRVVVPGSGLNPAIENGRTDIAGIYIPDLIKVDLSTSEARLAGGGPSHPTNPDDSGFSRLGIFGGDVLTSQIQSGFGAGTLPGGWPNGRRFGDDVLDIAVTALLSDLRVLPPVIQGPAGDNVDQNDMAFNKVFPYESTPQNGRVHKHH